MKKWVKYIIALSLVLINTVNVLAEEQCTTSYKVIVENGETTVTVDESFSDVDNSNLMVDVVKNIQGKSETIYSGILSGYDNGAWVHMDFSDVQFAVIFDWEQPDDSEIYIIPKKEIEKGLNQKSQSDKTITEGQNKTPVQRFSSGTELIEPSLSIAESFYINNVEVTSNFDSQSISANDNLLASYSITNMGDDPQLVQLILCVYGMNGVMLDAAITSDTILPNQTKNIQRNLTVGNDVSECYAKVFLWDGLNTLRPLHDTLQIGSESVDVNVVTATIDCVSNKEYNLVATVENMPLNDTGRYTITYDPSKIELVDLCSLTYKNELTAGIIAGTNINIISVDAINGQIVFENPNNSNYNTSKVLNAIKFRGLVSNEQTTIIIE